MKRVVICFDGTWKLPWDEDVSNVEKIARTVAAKDGHGEEAVEQVVHYVQGVGSSYRVDRALGGGIGLGISALIMGAYRFLALNFREGDELYVVGFSRGAFAARSLVGMVHRVGLVRDDALQRGVLKDVYAAYKRTRRGKDPGPRAAAFQRKYCHSHVCVPFLGVFDTVEALGPRARFHSIGFLGEVVAVGRQALAIDDRRRIFRPRLWEGDDHLAASGRVAQVWFRGCHSDVGGGVEHSGLPDTALLWMVREARAQGLAFDEDLLVQYLLSDDSEPHAAQVHESLRWYRVANWCMYFPWAASWSAFRRGRRVMRVPGAVGVGLSSSARATYDDERADYRPRNLRAWLDGAQDGGTEETTDVMAFPVNEAALIHQRLTAPSPPRQPCPAGHG